MIVPEELTISGKPFILQYSDIGMKLERDGEFYDEAYDPAELNRKYNETDIPIDKPTEPATDEATEADYQEALREMGVEL